VTLLPITEHELLALVEDLRDAHADTLPILRASLDDLRDDLADQRRGTLRRTVLATGGIAALAACSSGSKKPPPRVQATSARSAGPILGLSGDLKVVGLSAALENAAVAAYQQGITLANTGALGTVQPAVVSFVTTVKGQHTDHARAWNGFLQKNKKAAVTGIPLTIAPELTASFAAVTDVAGLAEAALALEVTATATYINAAAGISAQAGVATALSIAPVEAQHAAILSFLLGQEPVPAPLFNTTTALDVSSFTG
jgi:hypothetical protein